MEHKQDDVTMDDIQKQHRQYAAIIGIPNLIALSEEYGGTQIYIPQKEELLKNVKYRAIMKEFDGTNIKSLAKKYNVSESTVYRVVREQIIKNNSKDMEGQMSIFDVGVAKYQL